MKFEVGKFYKCRNGDKVQIIWDKVEHRSVAFVAIADQPTMWVGCYGIDGSHMSLTQYDIESEWEEPKPKRVAWIDPDEQLFLTNKTADLRHLGWTRIPYLDEPEDSK